MKPADEIDPSNLIGKRVAFRQDEDHAACWHFRAGLQSGRVTRLAQPLSHKAKLLREEGIELPDALPEDAAALRVWVHADPCPAFPQGCDAAVEAGCLLPVAGGELSGRADSTESGS